MEALFGVFSFFKTMVNYLNCNYLGSKVTFSRGTVCVMVNATEMAKPFGKRPSKWLELPSTKDFLKALSDVRKSDITLIYSRCGGDLNKCFTH